MNHPKATAQAIDKALQALVAITDSDDRVPPNVADVTEDCLAAIRALAWAGFADTPPSVVGDAFGVAVAAIVAVGPWTRGEITLAQARDAAWPGVNALLSLIDESN